MRIQFTQDIELEVITNYYEDTDSIDSYNETFNAGDEVEVEIFSEDYNSVDIQYPNGSVTLSLSDEHFKIQPE